MAQRAASPAGVALSRVAQPAARRRAPRSRPDRSAVRLSVRPSPSGGRPSGPRQPGRVSACRERRLDHPYARNLSIRRRSPGCSHVVIVTRPRSGKHSQLTSVPGGPSMRWSMAAATRSPLAVVEWTSSTASPREPWSSERSGASRAAGCRGSWLGWAGLAGLGKRDQPYRRHPHHPAGRRHPLGPLRPSHSVARSRMAARATWRSPGMVGMRSKHRLPGAVGYSAERPDLASGPRHLPPAVRRRTAWAPGPHGHGGIIHQGHQWASFPASLQCQRDQTPGICRLSGAGVDIVFDAPMSLGLGCPPLPLPTSGLSLFGRQRRLPDSRRRERRTRARGARLRAFRSKRPGYRQVVQPPHVVESTVGLPRLEHARP
jgi:hypothetical protein